jgi:hypothetical protein
MESQVDDAYFASSKWRGPFVFVIDFSDPTIEPDAFCRKR